MLSKEPVINPDDEAKVLGLKNPDAAVKVDVPVKKTADKDARMTRQQSLRASGKIAK